MNVNCSTIDDTFTEAGCAMIPASFATGALHANKMELF